MNYDDCQECRDRLWPDNPAVAQFVGLGMPRLRPICEGCRNSINGKPRDSVKQSVSNLSARITFLEEVDQPMIKQHDAMEQLQYRVVYLQKQIKELQITKKKGAKYE